MSRLIIATRIIFCFFAYKSPSTRRKNEAMGSFPVWKSFAVSCAYSSSLIGAGFFPGATGSEFVGSFP